MYDALYGAIADPSGKLPAESECTEAKGLEPMIILLCFVLICLYTITRPISPAVRWQCHLLESESG